MAEHYFIDGYNVLHRSSAFRDLAEEDFEAARDHLVDRIAQYCASSGVHATIVFDGRGLREERVSGAQGVDGFDVVYAAANKSADAIIERTVYQLSSRRGAVVVSGDRGITDLCIGLGALAMSPDAFLRSIVDETRRVRAKFERDRPDSSIARVEDTLSAESRSRLSRLRARLDEK